MSHRLNLSLIIQIPDVVAAIGNLVTKDLAGRCDHFVVSGSQYDNVSFKLRTVC